jgi:hypothetical protein
MKTALTLLTELQNRLFADADLTDPFHEYDRVLFAEVGGLLHVEYYGDWCEEPLEATLEMLARPEVAERLAVLHFDGPDEGANGSRAWDFNPLLATDALFPRLTTFRVAWQRPGDHNYPVIGYDEEGTVARLLDRLPNLKDLTVPSAPDAAFFDRPAHPLAYLRVATGYDHQNFILNLSQSRCFPNLFRFDFADYDQVYHDYPEACVPFDHYRALFQSPVLEKAHCAVWYAPWTAEQFRELRALKPHLGHLPPLPGALL